MKLGHEPLQPGRLDFDALGIPVSARYGDVYHARAGAMAQARHVFIQGNGLPERWVGQESFTVCETGFGLGNNFLALWQAWRDCPGRPQRLHVVSFEAHPFSREDLAVALAGHKGVLRDMADALLAEWPLLLPGIHRLEFEGGRLSLTLAFGRIEHLARQVEAKVDAFFLDGFSPAQNPAMWSRSLFGQLVRMANAGATAATWCSAGQVRRDLAAAGFLVTREPGFGGKRQMSRAVLRPGLGGTPLVGRCDDVIVVGGGLAGAGVAHSLALRGHGVTVLDPSFENGPAGSHTGHRCAAMTPALSRDDNFMSRLSRAGILLSQLRWRRLAGVSEGCGSLLRIAPEDAALWQRTLDEWRFPSEWMSWCEASETAERCGVPLSQGAVWLAQGALVRPSLLVETLLAHDGIRTRVGRVASVRPVAGGWQALGADGSVLAQAPRAVIAAAADSPALLPDVLGETGYAKLDAMQRMGGQVAYFRADGLPAVHAIVAGAGYWLPADKGVHVGGSTYIFDQPRSELSAAGFQEVAHKVAGLLEISPEAVLAARVQPEGWAGWRMAVRDHLPIIGPVDTQETLWMACAYGSRGLSWMTLAGEIIAARWNNEPMMVERELLRAVRLR